MYLSSQICGIGLWVKGRLFCTRLLEARKCEDKVVFRVFPFFFDGPLLSGDLAWYFCVLGQRFPPPIFSFHMNYKVAGANPGAGWLGKLPWFLGSGAVCGAADAQLRLSVSETAGFCLKVHVALAVVTVSLAYVTFIYPFPSFV